MYSSLQFIKLAEGARPLPCKIEDEFMEGGNNLDKLCLVISLFRCTWCADFEVTRVVVDRKTYLDLKILDGVKLDEEKLEMIRESETTKYITSDRSGNITIRRGPFTCLCDYQNGDIVRLNYNEPLAEVRYGADGQPANGGLQLYNGYKLDDLKKTVVVPITYTKKDSSPLDWGRMVPQYLLSCIARGDIDLKYCRIFDSIYNNAKYAELFSQKLKDVVDSLAEGQTVIIPISIHKHVAPIVVGKKATGEIVVAIFDSSGAFYHLYSKDIDGIRDNLNKIFGQFGSTEEILRESVKAIPEMQVSGTCSYHTEGFLVAATQYLAKHNDMAPDQVIEYFRSPQFITAEWVKATAGIISNDRYYLPLADITQPYPYTTTTLTVAGKACNVRDIFNMPSLTLAAVGLSEDIIRQLYIKYAYQLDSSPLGEHSREERVENYSIGVDFFWYKSFKKILVEHILRFPEDIKNREKLDESLRNPFLILQWAAYFMEDAYDYKFSVQDIYADKVRVRDRTLEIQQLFNTIVLKEAIKNISASLYAIACKPEYNIMGEFIKTYSDRELETEYGFNPSSYYAKGFANVVPQYIDDILKNGITINLDSLKDSICTPKFRLQWAKETAKLFGIEVYPEYFESRLSRIAPIFFLDVCGTQFKRPLELQDGLFDRSIFQTATQDANIQQKKMLVDLTSATKQIQLELFARSLVPVKKSLIGDYYEEYNGASTALNIEPSRPIMYLDKEVQSVCIFLPRETRVEKYIKHLETNVVRTGFRDEAGAIDKHSYIVCKNKKGTLHRVPLNRITNRILVQSYAKLRAEGRAIMM